MKLRTTCRKLHLHIVAPFAGAWIEIVYCGTNPNPFAVAPFAGAWIEIDKEEEKEEDKESRSLRGSVD